MAKRSALIEKRKIAEQKVKSILERRAEEARPEVRAERLRQARESFLSQAVGALPESVRFAPSFQAEAQKQIGTLEQRAQSLLAQQQRQTQAQNLNREFNSLISFFNQRGADLEQSIAMARQSILDREQFGTARARAELQRQSAIEKQRILEKEAERAGQLRAGLLPTGLDVESALIRLGTSLGGTVLGLKLGEKLAESDFFSGKKRRGTFRREGRSKPGEPIKIVEFPAA